jgi:hypothetical protein
VPDAAVRIVPVLEHLTRYATVQLVGVSGAISGVNPYPDPGETIHLQLPLFNYVTNPLNAGPVRFPVGILRSPTPGVDVTRAVSVYPTIPSGGILQAFLPFALRLEPTFDPGTPIELELTIISFDGLATLRHTLVTGTPVETMLLTENFDGVEPGVLPSGWTTAHGGGTPVVPWTTSRFCGESNGAFHQNADDNPAGQDTRWERLFSPTFTVPADAEYVELEFDVCYNTEEDPNFRVLAYDGFFLRIADFPDSAVPLRSVLVEAFEDEFTTGTLQHYPRHFPRFSNPAYFQDMSAWAGDSGGLRHVRMRLPGMQGRTAQLRFEFTQDPIFDCTALRPGTQCGVFVDNVVVKSIVSATPFRLTP